MIIKKCVESKECLSTHSKDPKIILLYITVTDSEWLLVPSIILCYYPCILCKTIKISNNAFSLHYK